MLASENCRASREEIVIIVKFAESLPRQQKRLDTDYIKDCGHIGDTQGRTNWTVIIIGFAKAFTLSLGVVLAINKNM